MRYEKITLEELFNLGLPNGVLPNFEYDSYDFESETYFGLTILKSPEDVYQEHLNQKLPEDKMEVLEQEVSELRKENKLLKAQNEALGATTDFHEELIAEMAMKVYA